MFVCCYTCTHVFISANTCPAPQLSASLGIASRSICCMRSSSASDFWARRDVITVARHAGVPGCRRPRIALARRPPTCTAAGSLGEVVPRGVRLVRPCDWGPSQCVVQVLPAEAVWVATRDGAVESARRDTDSPSVLLKAPDGLPICTAGLRSVEVLGHRGDGPPEHR